MKSHRHSILRALLFEMAKMIRCSTFLEGIDQCVVTLEISDRLLLVKNHQIVNHGVFKQIPKIHLT